MIRNGKLPGIPKSNKIFLIDVLKDARLSDVLIAKVTVFQNWAADTENEFSYTDVRNLGICNNWLREAATMSNMKGVIQEMPQSQSTAFPRHRQRGNEQ